MDIIEEFFAFCVKWNLKLHPANCMLYATSVRWCGSIISSKGIRYYTASIAKYLGEPAPGVVGNGTLDVTCVGYMAEDSAPEVAYGLLPVGEDVSGVSTVIVQRKVVAEIIKKVETPTTEVSIDQKVARLPTIASLSDTEMFGDNDVRNIADVPATEFRYNRGDEEKHG